MWIFEETTLKYGRGTFFIYSGQRPVVKNHKCKFLY
jgi:hypothetical protein